MLLAPRRLLGPTWLLSSHLGGGGRGRKQAFLSEALWGPRPRRQLLPALGHCRSDRGLPALQGPCHLPLALLSWAAPGSLLGTNVKNMDSPAFCGHPWSQQAGHSPFPGGPEYVTLSSCGTQILSAPHLSQVPVSSGALSPLQASVSGRFRGDAHGQSFSGLTPRGGSSSL